MTLIEKAEFILITIYDNLKNSGELTTNITSLALSEIVLSEVASLIYQNKTSIIDANTPKIDNSVIFKFKLSPDENDTEIYIDSDLFHLSTEHDIIQYFLLNQNKSPITIYKEYKITGSPPSIYVGNQKIISTLLWGKKYKF